jgi:tRNA pseudouridine55 synthase
MFGLLNVNKPRGVTSRDVVNRVARVLRGVKAGHAGTLDPLATGVLVVCLGPATRLVEYVQRMPKRYVGTFLLGRTSDTEDVEGHVTELVEPPHPTHEQIEQVLPKFSGEIEQLPPAFSALKVGGKRAYDLARQGKQVDLKPRRVVVHEIAVTRYEYPEIELEIACGSGTYIRSLGRDIARMLGTAAVMSALQRTAIGEFHVEQACQMQQLTETSLAEFVLPPSRALAELPSLRLTGDEIRRVSHGMSIENRWKSRAKEIAGLDESDRLVAILTPRTRDWLRPLRNFPIPDP